MDKETLPVPRGKGSIIATSSSALSVAVDREVVVEALRQLERERGSLSKAIQRLEFLYHDDRSRLCTRLVDALGTLIKGERSFISRNTLYEWCGKQDLKPLWRGRVSAPADHTDDLVRLFNIPGKSYMSDVHRKLMRLGHDCTYDQVRRSIKKLPAQVGKKSAARIGDKLYAQTQAPYVERSSENLLAGEIYMADGYKADIYLDDPRNPGHIWRPELMHVIDVKSRRLVGYIVMFSESAIDIMHGWATIFEKHDHVCVWIYVDNGTGYKNRLTQTDITSYLMRAGVQGVIHSLPYNAKGKGNVERYHRIVRDRFLKFWRPEFYCGPDMAADVLNKTTREVKAGRLRLPTIGEFCEAYDSWLDNEYHREPHPEYSGKTRADVWAELQCLPPYKSAVEMARPAELRMVKRGAVTIYNRRYGHPALMSWNEKQVIVEYDVRREGVITVRDPHGDFICDASLVKKVGYVKESILLDHRAKAQAAAEKRAQKKLDEIKARNGTVIDADALVDSAIPAVTQTDQKRLPPSDGDDFNLFDL